MGSRTLPYECEHGMIVDWGDFGPDPDDGSYKADDCPECEQERLSRVVVSRDALRLILDRYENGDTGADDETDSAVRELKQAVKK